MERYTRRELRDMHFVYGAAEGNGRRALEIYWDRFARRRYPHYRTFSGIHDRLGNTGTLMVSRGNAGPPRTELRIENN